jgi:hypothetical protein
VARRGDNTRRYCLSAIDGGVRRLTELTSISGSSLSPTSVAPLVAGASFSGNAAASSRLASPLFFFLRCRRFCTPLPPCDTTVGSVSSLKHRPYELLPNFETFRNRKLCSKEYIVQQGFKWTLT